jgi:hypothetical protein
MDGAAGGFNRLTLTAYRPPETIGVPGLPLYQAPDWATTATLHCWDPAASAVFVPVAGYPALYAARDFFVERLNEFGFKATPSFDAASGMSYDITGAAGDD